MGVQVPCRVHTKVPQEVAVRQIRQHLGTVFHELARRKECQIEEGHLMPHHVHILISIPPKYSVAEVIGYLKGKSSIWVAQNVERKARNFLGHKFWARGYFVSTVGRDEEMIRTYIKNQEMADQQLDQLQLKLASS
jgi:putative transposase